MKSTMTVPRLRHTAITISEGMASASEPRKSGDVRPTSDARPAISPSDGSRTKRQATAIATMLVTTGA